MESTRGGPGPVVGDGWDPDPGERGWNPQPHQIGDGDRPGFSGQAIVSVVFGGLGMLLGIPGLILAIAAIQRINRGEKRGLALAVIGLILNGLWLIGVVVAAAILILGRTANAPAPPPAAGSHPLAIGDCVGTLERRDIPTYKPASVPCAEPHQGEVFGTFTLEDGLYPRANNIDFKGRGQCGQAKIDGYAGRPGAATTVDVLFLYPSQAEWDAGWRAVVCVVHHATPRTGSLRNASASP